MGQAIREWETRLLEIPDQSEGPSVWMALEVFAKAFQGAMVLRLTGDNRIDYL